VTEGNGVAQIRLSGVTKVWGAEPAVDDVSFAAEPGSLLVLLGPSGCGKSTTLRLIAGLDLPDAGHIEIGGRNVTREPPSRRGVAMVFQSYALFPHLSVAENIVFGLKVRRIARAERVARLQRTAELVTHRAGARHASGSSGCSIAMPGEQTNGPLLRSVALG
jgi:sn-glycerol 3-phosphate transport system ATP-binding protein